jgi:hypothetical protein
MPALLLAALLAAAPQPAAPVPATATAATAAARPLDPAAAARFAELALSCVAREYPNKISHVLAGAADARPPSELTPAFFGCFDWHSAVHAHWLLARLARLHPEAPFATRARAALARSLTAEKLMGELLYLKGAGRTSFERPYGLAWLLALGAELRRFEDPTARAWAALLRPLEAQAVVRLSEWLPKLRYPIRIGEHDQTAFALGLALDHARVAGDAVLEALVTSRARAFYGADVACPIGYEPSGQDFLSPCLAEADLMRRVLAPAPFASWLDRFLPGLSGAGEGWLAPAEVTDRGDPKLAHLDGLNLSRAWMLEGIATGLAPSDPRRGAILGAAARHRAAALPAVTGEHYEGGHWLGTFAVYLTSGAGLP